MKKTYVTLFSCAGIGCYGFKMNDFECVATCTLLPREMEIQKLNDKCKYESGYVCGDITLEETKSRIYNEIDMWKSKEDIDDIDVVIATPPCQGMSFQNRVTTEEKDINRNSLVIEAIQIVNKINPKFFVFENVRAFLRTACVDENDVRMPIEQAIRDKLGPNYEIAYRLLNFKDYGVNSSRTRYIVIGVRKDIEANPYDLYPDQKPAMTIRECVGHMKPLNEIGEIDENDWLHIFYPYADYMRPWIHATPEGGCAHNNERAEDRPHFVIDGKIVPHKNNFGGQWTRTKWDDVKQCIMTSACSVTSQRTIHPVDDRAFSPRELMLFQGIPDSFIWCAEQKTMDINSLPPDEKKKIVDKYRTRIYHVIGECVPTPIFNQVAKKISDVLENKVEKPFF